jgi:PKD repeat protein
MREAMSKLSVLLKIAAIIGLAIILFANGARSQSVTAGFTYTSDCMDFSFQNTSISTGGEITSYSWDFGDGSGTSGAENPNYTYAVPGNYDVTLTVTNAAMHTDDYTETVIAITVTANFSYFQDCELYHFINTSSPEDDLDSVFWHFGEGDTVRLYNPPFNYDHTYSGSGSYPIYIRSFIGDCSDKKNSSIDFFLPVPDFTYSQVIDTFYFQDLSTPVGEITSWYWDFGDGYDSDQQNPSHFYEMTGNYTVTLEINTTQGCTQITSRPLVFYIPVADFTFTSNCETFQFEDLSAPADSIVGWSWDFGDGVGTSSAQNPVYSYPTEGEYTVLLEVTLESGSSDTATHVISFYHPMAKYSRDPACLGVQTCFYDESLPVMGNIVSWHWDFGDGSSSSLPNPCYTYGTPGEYYVTLTVENSIGCISVTENDTLFVDSPPIADFIGSSACFNEITYFANLTDTNNIAISSWQWDFGDPASGANNTSGLFEPLHLYTTAGTFPVTLSVENINGCVSTKFKSVIVDSIPLADFTLPDTIAAGTLFTITDNSIAFGTPIITRFWDFGDGVTITNPNPVTHIYSGPGEFTICLIVTNTAGCSDTSCQTIVITSLPHADFDYNIGPGLITHFSDVSYTESLVVDWFWDFGDLTVTNDTLHGYPNPAYTYPAEGFYSVYLRIQDYYGGIHDTLKTIYVGTAVIADFVNEDICSGEDVKLFDESYTLVSADFISWYWDFGDESDTLYFQKTDSIYHHYDTAGIYDVTLITTGVLNGEISRDTIIKQVIVFNPPVANIDSLYMVACLGQPINFVDSSYSIDGDSITAWQWDFGDGGSSNLQNPSYVYDSIKEYQAILTITTIHGCQNKDTITAKVTIAPDIDFVIDNACVNSPAYFLHTESDIEITDWFWNFNDQYHPGVDTSTVETPSYIYTHIDVYHVTMEASSYGCVKKVEKSFIVYPIPYSDFTITPNLSGVQGRTSFSNSSIYATSYLWDFGNGHTSNVEDPIEVYEHDSTYTITLISFNEYGCSDTSRYDLTVFFRGLYIPTAFSPNNPNYEISRFMPKGINLAEYFIQVFDMKGNLMWESDKLDEYGSPAESWDGYCNGLLMPEGMYVWKAQGIFKDGTEWKGSDLQTENPQTNGTVTLIK